MIKPTVGRVVLYKPLESDEGEEHVRHAALIAAVFDDHTVNLMVADSNGVPYHRQVVKLVQDPDVAPLNGQCKWPQHGQAAKYDTAMDGVLARIAVLEKTLAEHTLPELSGKEYVNETKLGDTLQLNEVNPADADYHDNKVSDTQAEGMRNMELEQTMVDAFEGKEPSLKEINKSVSGSGKESTLEESVKNEEGMEFGPGAKSPSDKGPDISFG